MKQYTDNVLVNFNTTVVFSRGFVLRSYTLSTKESLGHLQKVIDVIRAHKSPEMQMYADILEYRDPYTDNGKALRMFFKMKYPEAYDSSEEWYNRFLDETYIAFAIFDDDHNLLVSTAK